MRIKIPRSQFHGKELPFLRVDLEFICATSKYNLEYESPSEESFNYYYPHCSSGITNIKAYNKITFQNYYITTDYSGDVIFCGYTNSNNFQVTVGAFQTNALSISESFIAKFNKAGNRVWTTYYGGSLDENANALDKDASNNIFVTGNIECPNLPIRLINHLQLFSNYLDKKVIVN